MIRFTKATRETGVDGHFAPDDPRVTVKPEELPAPLYPEDDGFWDQFGDTIDAVCQAKDRARFARGVAASLEPVIQRRADYAARLVHKDWPAEVMTHAVQHLAPGFHAFNGVRQNFTDGLVMLSHLMSWSAHAVSPNSFCAKWHFMVPRPEEVAHAVATDQLDAPEDIKLRLYDMAPKSVLAATPTQFTMYPEGCPNHPAYNAMHSAAAGAEAAVIRVVCALDELATAEVNLCARNMAFFRSSAGVHYPQDNRVGLWLGEETMRRLLPAKMAELGFSKGEVAERLAAVAVDWLAT